MNNIIIFDDHELHAFLSLGTRYALNVTIDVTQIMYGIHSYSSGWNPFFEFGTYEAALVTFQTEHGYYIIYELRNREKVPSFVQEYRSDILGKDQVRFT